MFSKRSTKKILCCLCGSAFITSGNACRTSESPDIIFILVDDMGWMDLSVYGSNFYETPHIDNLANEGILFTNAYAAAPVSSPSRVCLQTGKYPVNTGITDVIAGRYQYQKALIDSVCPVLPPAYPVNMPLEEVTIAEALKSKHYNTYFLGKWHCAEDSTHYPQYQGYDFNFGGSNRGDVGKKGYFAPYNLPGITAKHDTEFLTDRITDEAIQKINESNGPYFMFISYYLVHTPLQAKETKISYFEEKIRKKSLLDSNVYNEHPGWLDRHPFPDKYRERIVQSDAVYAAMISILDENIGKLITYLKEKGTFENTIIIVTSDNGGLSTSVKSPTSNLPLKGGKGHLYEGGIRVPLLVKSNQKEAKGKISNEIIAPVDLYPTILEFAGIKTEKSCNDGFSFSRLFYQDNFKMPGRPVFWHFPHYPNHGGRPSGAVRHGKYKLIEFFDTGQFELYNLSTDIGEHTDLKDTYPDIANEMLTKLRNWQKQKQVLFPVKNQKYKNNEL